MQQSDTRLITVRPAPEDLPALGRLGALLIRIHHEFDPERFIVTTRESSTNSTRTWSTSSNGGQTG